MAAPRVARQGEAWWACLDSNQEPDRYERPALTIELQARASVAACDTRRCRFPLQCSVGRSNGGPRNAGLCGTAKGVLRKGRKTQIIAAAGGEFRSEKQKRTVRENDHGAE